MHFINEMSSDGYFSLLIMVLTGIVTTILLQSSTATMALTIILCNKGWLPFEVASAMILGANIGTTFTAEIAALIGNTNAKRSAKIHTMFNIFGAIWMFPILPFFIKGIDMLGTTLFYNQSAYFEQYNIPIALSIFHSSFNILNTCIFLFIPQFLIKAATKTIRNPNPKFEEKFELNLQPFNNIFTLPELSIIQTKKRISDLIHDLRKFNQHLIMLNLETETDQKQRIFDSISKLNTRIKNLFYIIEMDVEEVISQETSIITAKHINLIQETNQKLELVYSNYLNIFERYQYKNNSGFWFDPVQRNYINLLLEKQYISLKPILSYFEKNQIPAHEELSLIKYLEIEKNSEIDTQENELTSASAFTNMQKGIIVYSEMKSLLILNSEIIHKCIQQIRLSANVK
jgi:phosphate:Na+ symporter